MQSRQIFKVASLILITFGLHLPTVNATVVKKLSEEELTSQARTILIGTCTSIMSEWNEERTKIFTYITISPQTSLKGDQVPQEIIVKQPGGEVGEIGMRVEGTSVYEEGEEVLLFLKKGRKGFHRTLGFSQGKFSIKTDPSSQRKILVKKRFKRMKTLDGRIAKKIVEVKSEKKLFLDEFASRIQNILQNKNAIP